MGACAACARGCYCCPVARVLAALAAVVFLLASCGGDDTFTLDSSVDCLARLGETSNAVSSFAQTASGGAMRLDYEGREVIVAFAKDGREASEIADAYMPSRATLEYERNVVIVWTDEPRDDQSNAVRDCLA